MTRLALLVVAACCLAVPAFADPAADARAHEEAFARACNAGDVKAVMDLYADDAVVVWPGQGMEAKGKADIEKLVAGLCKPQAGGQFTLRSVQGIPLGDTHLATVAHWDDTTTRPGGARVTRDVRSTEVLVKQDGKWRYLVDHASIGLPRPTARRERRTR